MNKRIKGKSKDLVKRLKKERYYKMNKKIHIILKDLAERLRKEKDNKLNKRIYERSKNLIKKLREDLTKEEFEKKVTKIINVLRATNELTINLEIFSHVKITVNAEDRSIEEKIIEIIFEEYVNENNLNNFKLELEKESFQFDTINHEGKIIIPEWYKSDKITYILLKNVDKISKNSIAMKQLKTLIKECSIREKELSKGIHFIIISNRDLAKEYAKKIIETNF
jgi:hypothetical protein